MKTVSQIFEEIKESLLAEDSLYTVSLIDPNGITHKGTEPIEIKNPFDFDYSRMVPNSRPMDLDRFIEVAEELIDWAQDSEGVIESEKVQILGEYPHNDFSQFKSGEVITWRLISREPAKMSREGTGRPQRGYSFSHELQDPTLPNKVITVNTRPLDHIVEFSVWSKDAGKANRRAIWLERLFIAHSWAFKIQGADRFFFEKRGADNYRTTGGQPIYERPLRFKVRLFEFQIIASPIIRHINFSLGRLISNEET